jgi:hypothetical protein
MEESKKYKHLLEKLEHEKMNQLKNHQLEINELCRQFEEEKVSYSLLIRCMRTNTFGFVLICRSDSVSHPFSRGQHQLPAMPARGELHIVEMRYVLI